MALVRRIRSIFGDAAPEVADIGDDQPEHGPNRGFAVVDLAQDAGAAVGGQLARDAAEGARSQSPLWVGGLVGSRLH